MKVLIIEDNVKIASAIQSGLTSRDYIADVSNTGFEGEDQASTGSYDVVVLDLMLPDRDGIEVCRNLRRRGVASRILMLTALNSTDNKVAGFDAGADDYLTKPFEFEEFVARIRALGRRSDPKDARLLKYDDVELDVYTRKVTRGDREFELSNREFALLEYFMRNVDKVLSRPQIGEQVWEARFEPTSNVVDVYVSALRRKIDRGFNRDLIQTVKGCGYMFGHASSAGASSDA